MNNMTDDFTEGHGQAADFAEQVRRNQQKLVSQLQTRARDEGPLA